MANKYMYLYRGSGAPPTSEAEGKAMMAAWMGYFGKLGSALVEGGAPFAPQSKLIGKGGATIVAADGLDKAIAMTDGHPLLAGGGAIEVFELAPIPGM